MKFLRFLALAIWLIFLLWQSIAAESSDLYAIFGLTERTFTVDALKKAYKKLSLQWHPDTNKSPEAEGKFQHITYAYSILSNEEQRLIYNKYGEKGVKQHGDSPNSDAFNPFDILSQYVFPISSV